MTRLIIVAILLWTTPAFAGEYCQICDKRFGKWTPFWSGGGWGDMMPHSSGPNGTWFGTPKHKMGGESEIEVCPDCERKYSESYKRFIKSCSQGFIEAKRELEQPAIDRNRKDNAVYKEKQDEIDRLQRKIQELEWERQGIVPLTRSGLTPFSGATKTIRRIGND